MIKLQITLLNPILMICFKIFKWINNQQNPKKKNKNHNYYLASLINIQNRMSNPKLYKTKDYSLQLSLKLHKHKLKIHHKIKACSIKINHNNLQDYSIKINLNHLDYLIKIKLKELDYLIKTKLHHQDYWILIKIKLQVCFRLF